MPLYCLFYSLKQKHWKEQLQLLWFAAQKNSLMLLGTSLQMERNEHRTHLGPSPNAAVRILVIFFMKRQKLVSTN